MSPQMSRRSFLRLLSLLLLTPLLNEREHFVEQTKNSSQNEAAPNVLILLFDALSAKNVSVYGYNRETTPNLARFAERATVYHAHYAAGNHTPPGTSSSSSASRAPIWPVFRLPLEQTAWRLRGT